jgi:DNA-binding transcriptional LysR family regulator
VELRHLRYFVAVAEELHFGRAAARLHITQPPLSQQIQLLERELGVQLLVRGRKVQLTPAGRVFLEEARRTIDVADRATRAARAAAAGSTSRLRVGYPADTMFSLVPAALRAYSDQYPEVDLAASAGRSGELLTALRDDQIDIALLHTGTRGSQTVRTRLLHSEPVVVAIPAGHKLTGHDVVDPADLCGETPVLLPRPLEHLRERLTGVNGNGDGPDVREMVTLESTYSAVAAGLGVALLAESTARSLQVTGVTHRPLGGTRLLLELNVAWPRRATSSEARSFARIAMELATQTSAPVVPLAAGLG